MSRPVQKVAVIGATGQLGTHIVNALVKAGFTVTAIQREGSTNSPPAGIVSIKVDLTNKEQLTTAFCGQDAVVSAVPNPDFSAQKAMVDAAIAAAVKRIIPSEYSTNLENALARNLPMVRQKAATRDYITSVLPRTSTTTTWTGINNGPFFEMCLKYGALGPNLATKSSVFHNGGANIVGASRLADIGLAVAKVLDPAHFAETANTPVYVFSAAVSEVLMTRLAAEVTGFDFGSVEDGRISNVDTEVLKREADEKLGRGEGMAGFAYYYQMMYGKGYEGDTRHMAWNDRLGLKTMTEEDIKDAIRETAKELGVL